MLGVAASPDGQHLVFLERVGPISTATGYVKALPLSGGQPRELIALPPGEQRHGMVGLAVTPDGRHVIFGKRTAPDTAGLWRVPLAGGEASELGLAMQYLSHISLHPDGRRIAFTAGKFNNEVWVMENFLPEPTAAP